MSALVNPNPAPPPRVATFSLIDEILSRSKSKLWGETIKEWEYAGIRLLEPGEESQHCLCGHEIRELHFVENSGTNEKATVGSCCIKKFFVPKVVKSAGRIKIIKKDIGRALDADTIARAFEAGWINVWEFHWYNDTRTKRKLSEKMFNIRTRINRTVLLHLCQSQPPK